MKDMVTAQMAAWFMVLHRLLCKQILTGRIRSLCWMPVHVVTSCQPVAGMKYVQLIYISIAVTNAFHQHRILHCEGMVDRFTIISSLLCWRAPEIRLLGSMHPATSWQVVEHCKEMVVQITTILSFSCERISKIMSLSLMNLATSHQSVVRLKYVPYKYLLLDLCRP